MSDNITIYRRRHIPDEIVKLDKDTILYKDDDVIITSWKCIHEREDIERGVSAYFLKKGYKVSKMYNANGDIVYWYCDIMDVFPGNNDNDIIYEDMLLDVIVYPDGSVHVVDADEFAKALEKGMITQKDAVKALNSLDNLLKIIYSGRFGELKDVVERRE